VENWSFLTEFFRQTNKTVKHRKNRENKFFPTSSVAKLHTVFYLAGFTLNILKQPRRLSSGHEMSQEDELSSQL
jgi:hypothetical protein